MYSNASANLISDMPSEEAISGLLMPFFSRFRLNVTHDLYLSFNSAFLPSFIPSSIPSFLPSSIHSALIPSKASHMLSRSFPSINTYLLFVSSLINVTVLLVKSGLCFSLYSLSASVLLLYFT